MPRNDRTLNQNANLIHFNTNEDAFNDYDATVIDDGHVAMMIPTMPTTAADHDDEPAKFQNELSTLSYIVVTEASNDSFLVRMSLYLK